MSEGKVKGYLYVNFMTGGPHLVIGGGLGWDLQMFICDKQWKHRWHILLENAMNLGMCGTLIAGGAFPQWISYTLLPFSCCVGMAVAQVAFYSVMMVKRIYGWVILFPLLWRPRRSTKMVRARSAFLHKNDNFLFLDFFDGFSKHYPKYYGPAAWTWCMGVCEWMILRVHRLEFIHFWFFSLPVIYLLRGVAWILAMP